MGTVIFRKCNGVYHVVARYGKIVDVGLFVVEKCEGGWDEFHGIFAVQYVGNGGCTL